MKPLILIALLAKSLDVTSTCDGLSRNVYEANPLLPNSCVKQLGIQIPAAVAEIVMLSRLHRTHPKLANGLTIVISSVHFTVAIHNYKEISNGNR